ncbi:ficolin-1-like [Strongylocentrotus purpuratus]|uniref:Fibrinogen C-terminal domain-containing protein n=1 Tax=Strongylocentrotus purpuratus TaxID=7668 RepID=A0A7M7RG33_STRPU|nr:ficolin-1-like [Strongylocentrotus purpuratus]
MDDKRFSSVFPGQPQDCADIQGNGVNISGIYGIYPGGVGRPFNVYCDMDTDGGGWTVFQRRMDGSVSFSRNWSDYKIGFGSISSEHWLGNDKIHQLTNQKMYELWVDLEDFAGENKYAIYYRFNVGNESDQYKLKLGSLINGTAGNCFGRHSGSAFSTVDRDHDESPTRHCANYYESGWWFKNCYCCNLNGHYYLNPTGYKNGGVIWQTWHGYKYSLKGTEMKIRPVNP